MRSRLVAGRGRRSIVVASSVLLISLALGCSGSEGPRGESARPGASCSRPAGDMASDHLWVWYGVGSEYQPKVADLLHRFEVERGIPVESELVPLSEVEARLRALPEGARVPDLVLAAEVDVRRLADSGAFLPAEGCLELIGSSLDRELLDVARLTWSLDGELWAIPFNLSTPLLYYNRHLLAEAGLYEPPQTIADVAAATRMLTASGSSQGLVFDQNLIVWVAEQWPARQGQPLIGQVGQEAFAHLDAPELIADLSQLRDLVNEGAATYVGTNPSGAEDLMLLLSEQRPGAMVPHTSGSLGATIEVARGVGVSTDDYAVGPLPAPTRVGASDRDVAWMHGSGALAGGAAWWVTARGNADPAVAVSLAAFLASPRQQAELARTTGYVPISPTATLDPALTERWSAHPQLEVPYDILAAVPDDQVFAGPQVGPRREIRALVIRAFDRILAGEEPAEALRAARLGAEQLLRAYQLDAPR